MAFNLRDSINNSFEDFSLLDLLGVLCAQLQIKGDEDTEELGKKLRVFGEALANEFTCVHNEINDTYEQNKKIIEQNEQIIKLLSKDK